MTSGSLCFPEQVLTMSLAGGIVLLKLDIDSGIRVEAQLINKTLDSRLWDDIS